MSAQSRSNKNSELIYNNHTKGIWIKQDKRPSIKRNGEGTTVIEKFFNSIHPQDFQPTNDSVYDKYDSSHYKSGRKTEFKGYTLDYAEGNNFTYSEPFPTVKTNAQKEKILNKCSIEWYSAKYFNEKSKWYIQYTIQHNINPYRKIMMSADTITLIKDKTKLNGVEQRSYIEIKNDINYHFIGKGKSWAGYDRYENSLDISGNNRENIVLIKDLDIIEKNFKDEFDYSNNQKEEVIKFISNICQISDNLKNVNSKQKSNINRYLENLQEILKLSKT